MSESNVPVPDGYEEVTSGVIGADWRFRALMWNHTAAVLASEVGKEVEDAATTDGHGKRLSERKFLYFRPRLASAPKAEEWRELGPEEVLLPNDQQTACGADVGWIPVNDWAGKTVQYWRSQGSFWRFRRRVSAAPAAPARAEAPKARACPICKRPEGTFHAKECEKIHETIPPVASGSYWFNGMVTFGPNGFVEFLKCRTCGKRIEEGGVYCDHSKPAPVLAPAPLCALETRTPNAVALLPQVCSSCGERRRGLHVLRCPYCVEYPGKRWVSGRAS